MISDVNVLRTYIFNKDFRLITQEHFKSYMFMDAHCQEIFEMISDYQIQNSKFPETNLEILITNNPWHQDREQIQEKFVILRPDNPKDYEELDLNDTLKETEDWVRHRMFGHFLQHGVNMFQKNGVDLGDINSFTKKINQFSFFKTDLIDNMDDDYMYNLLANDLPRISFSWPSLNKMLGGGVYYKSLNMIMGGTHAGKSRILATLASDIAMQDPKNEILYVTLEQPKENFRLAFEQHFTKMSKQQLKDFALSNKTKWKQLRNKIKEKYGITHIKEGSSTNMSAITLRNIIDDMLQKGHNLKGIFVDYLQIMKPTIKVAGLYEKGDANALDLRAIAQDFAIPTWSAAQPGREGNRKNMKSGSGADMMDVGESKSIPDHSDLFCNIISTPEMYRNDRQIFYFHKNRHGNEIHKSLLMEIHKNLYQIDFMCETEDITTEEHNQETENFDVLDFSKPVI